MRILLQIFFLFISIFNVNGQTWDVKISGIVRDADKKSIENIPVVLMENRDTIAIQQSSKEGEFLFEVSFSLEKNYYLFLNIAHQNTKHNWIEIHAKGDSNVISEYYLEPTKLRLIQDRFDTGIYYEKNETVNYQNFDLIFFKQMLIEYPQMCIRFVQTLNPDEKKTVAKKRKKQFLKLLRTTGVNMNQIIFSDEILILDFSKSEDKRSRIEGVVYSMNGNCK